MADTKQTEDPKQKQQQEGAEPPEDAKGAQDDPKPKGSENGSAEPPVVDSHGQLGINKERHDREMAEKDQKIAELEAKLEEATKTAEGRAEVLKELQEVKASLADEKVSHALELAGCLNVKMAKAVLADEYGGDVSKLKEACPYLFNAKQEGSTGLPPKGAPSSAEERRKVARKAAGLE